MPADPPDEQTLDLEAELPTFNAGSLLLFDMPFNDQRMRGPARFADLLACIKALPPAQQVALVAKVVEAWGRKSESKPRWADALAGKEADALSEVERFRIDASESGARDVQLAFYDAGRASRWHEVANWKAAYEQTHVAPIERLESACKRATQSESLASTQAARIAELEAELAEVRSDFAADLKLLQDARNARVAEAHNGRATALLELDAANRRVKELEAENERLRTHGGRSACSDNGDGSGRCLYCGKKC